MSPSPSRLLPPEGWPTEQPDFGQPYDSAELRDATRWLCRAGLLDTKSHRLLVSIRRAISSVARETEVTSDFGEAIRFKGERRRAPYTLSSKFLRALPVTCLIPYQLFEVFRGIVHEGRVSAPTRAALTALSDALMALRATPSFAMAKTLDNQQLPGLAVSARHEHQRTPWLPLLKRAESELQRKYGRRPSAEKVADMAQGIRRDEGLNLPEVAEETLVKWVREGRSRKKSAPSTP